jgi:predicted nucleic acid-binding protein
VEHDFHVPRIGGQRLIDFDRSRADHAASDDDSLRQKPGDPARLAEYIRSLPPGSRSKEDVDRQIDEGLRALGLVSVSDELLEQAVSLRARFGLRSADAVHLATTIAHTADVFLTGDRQLARCTDINVVPIP